MNKKQKLGIFLAIIGIVLVFLSQSSVFWVKKTYKVSQKDHFGYSNVFGQEKEQYKTVYLPNNALIYGSLSGGIILILVGAVIGLKGTPKLTSKNKHK
jgi:drug/metabolite transporter (DMT)-like permease